MAVLRASRLRLLMVAVPLALAAGLILYARLAAKSEGGDTVEGDPVLEQARRMNPGLRIEKRVKEDFDRVPLFWATEPGTGRTAPLPRSLAEDNAVLDFRPCHADDIPARLRYPKGTTPECLTVTTDDHRLDAFWFRAPDRLTALITHYDGAIGPADRPRIYEEQRREGPLPGGGRGFRHYYFLYEVGKGTAWETTALVGYKRERRERPER